MTNKNEDSKRRIDEILSGSYTENLDTKSEKEIRELRDTAREISTLIGAWKRWFQMIHWQILISLKMMS